MDRSISVVMLAGTIRPSALRSKLDIPLLCLPMGRRGTLLDAWQTALTDLDPEAPVTVVLNSQSDVEAVERTAGGRWPGLRSIAEPAAWRGVGGIMRDVSSSLGENTLVLAVEANALPPARLGAVPAAFDDSLDGLVGVCGHDQPAGVYAFTQNAIDRIPSVGYYDMKEQFLPALHDDGLRVKAVDLGDAPMTRISDRATYLDAVRQTLQDSENGKPRIMPGAAVSGSAILEGACMIASGAVVEDGAVVHDSVVLAGATVGGGAIVSRSVVGPLTEVAARARVLRQVIVNGRGDVGRGRRRWIGQGRPKGEAAAR